LLELLGRWAGKPRPQLVVILDVDPALAWERSSGPRDRIESRGLDYLRRVSAGFRRYAERAREPVTIVDGAGGADEVFERILQEVTRASA